MWHALIERWQGFSNEQKISVVLLGICGGLALGLSLYRVQASVSRPFLVDKNEILNAKEVIGETPEEIEARQKRTDTDGDTISDWDETNLTKTNPNLRDSCGDGVPDNVRVASGGTGDCAAPVSGSLGSEGASVKPTTQSGFFPFGMDVTGSEEPTTEVDETQKAELQKILPRDPKSVREALRGQVDQEKLDALTDEELLELYDQAIEMQASQPVSPTTPSSP